MSLQVVGFKVADPKVKKAKVFWNNRHDSSSVVGERLLSIMERSTRQ
jgi:hypothetical protein